MGRSAEGQLVKGLGPSQRGAASNQMERGSRQRGRDQPQKARPPTSIPFPSTYTFSSPHVVSAGQCGGAQKRKHQECREIWARGSWAQPNGVQTMSAFIPATLWSCEVQPARESRPQKPFLCALAGETDLSGRASSLGLGSKKLSEMGEKSDNLHSPGERHHERDTSHGATVLFIFPGQSCGNTRSLTLPLCATLAL